MPAICTDTSGEYIYMALEDSSTGHQIVVRVPRAGLSAGLFSTAYAPGAGSACNVTPAGDNAILLYGNFGTDITAVLHTVSTGAEADISPASLGSKIVNAAAVNPSNPVEMMITVGTDQDVLYTDDDGATWTALEDVLGFDATALAVLGTSLYEAYRAFVAGHNGANIDILYTPNEFASTANVEGALSTANIVALEVSP